MAKDKVIIWMDNKNVEGIAAAKIAVVLGYEYEVKNVSSEFSWVELEAAVPGAGVKRDAPQIFIGTKHIGGLKAFMTEVNFVPPARA